MTDTPSTITPIDDGKSLPGEKPTTTAVPVKTDNHDAFTTAPAAPPIEPKMPIAEEAAKPEPLPVTVPAVVPLVVTEAEVKDDVSEHQKLAEEIEILTGEIQALEAKIERLAGAATATAETSAAAPVLSMPAIPPISGPTKSPMSEPMPTMSGPMTPAISELSPAPVAGPPVEPKPTIPESTIPAFHVPASAPVPVSHAPSSSNLSDIYPKKDPEISLPPPASASPIHHEEEHQSVLGMIGEIIGIIGVVLFVLMMLSPLYKEMLDPTLWETVRTFGWLSAVIALVVGFVFSLFQHGKWGMKIFLLIVLLLAGAMYYAISNPGSFLEPALGSILSFYQ